MIWPFVQGYWARAASKYKRTDILYAEFKKLTKLFQKKNDFREFYWHHDGIPDGGHNQLWSASGYLSMIFHGLFGITFDVDGIRFDPNIPKELFSEINIQNKISIYNMTINNMKLDIHITGVGSNISNFLFNHKLQDENKIFYNNIYGHNQVEIKLFV